MLGRPSADVIEWPNEKDFSGDLLVEVEVDVRPDFELPAFEGTTLEVDAVEVDEAAIDEELDRLRARFGTLVTVDRPAATGDFVELDLVATIDGAEIDRAEGVSYEVGSGELLEGIDEAIDSLTAGEDTTFRSTLDRRRPRRRRGRGRGRRHGGQGARASRGRRRLRSDRERVRHARRAARQPQGARRPAVRRSPRAPPRATSSSSSCSTQVEIPVPPQLIEDEVHNHLEGEGRLEDDVHRAEVTEASEKQFRTQMLLDAIAENLNVSGLAG